MLISLLFLIQQCEAFFETNSTISTTLRRALLDTMPDLLASRVGAVYNATVAQPLYRLYRHGPAFAGFGFWRSQESADVCAALTKIDAKHWRDNEARCEQFIYAEFRSYLILIETCFYFCTMLFLMRALVSLCMARLASSSLSSSSSSRNEKSSKNEEAVSSPVKLLRAIVTLLARAGLPQESKNDCYHRQTQKSSEEGDYYANRKDDLSSQDSPYKTYDQSLSRRAHVAAVDDKEERRQPAPRSSPPPRRMQTRSATRSAAESLRAAGGR